MNCVDGAAQPAGMQEACNAGGSPVRQQTVPPSKRFPSASPASTSCEQEAAQSAGARGGQGAVRGGGSGDGAGSLPGKPADIVCAMNFSVCLLHDRADVQVGDRVHQPSLQIRDWGEAYSLEVNACLLHDQEVVQVGTCRLLILCTMHDALGLRWAEVVGSTDMLSCRETLFVAAMYTSRCPNHLLNTRPDVCTDGGCTSALASLTGPATEGCFGVFWHMYCRACFGMQGHPAQGGSGSL